MILTQENRTIDTNVDQSQVFKIKTTAQAFKILSSNLYANKIEAIIRELSCNAYDAHVLAKNKNPFIIHLPSDMEPYFSVKDNGVGLSESDIFELYTSYFESTKSQSNDFVGALGLGSKSPFSYTDSFTVESIYNFEKKDYTAYISEAGVPTISLINTCPSNEHNGLEVKISVKPEDYVSFKQEAEKVFLGFDQLPIIRNTSQFSDLKSKLTVCEKGKDYTIYNEYYILPERLMAKQGCVLYPIVTNNLPDISKEAKEFFGSYNCVINFDLGQLDIAASREGLSYDLSTIKILTEKLNRIYNELSIKVEKVINKKSLYQAIQYLNNYPLYFRRKFKWQKGDKQKYIDRNSTFGIKYLNYFSVDTNLTSPYGIKLTNHQNKAIDISPSERFVFLKLDKEIPYLKMREKIRQLIVQRQNEKLSTAAVFTFLPNEYKILKELGNPASVLLSSIKEIEDTIKKPKIKTVRNVAKNYFTFSYIEKCIQRHKMKSYDDLADEKEIYYMVALSDNEYEGTICNYSEEKFAKFLNYLKNLGIFDISKYNCYLVLNKETKYKRFIDDKRFINVNSVIDKKINEFIDDHQNDIVDTFNLILNLDYLKSFQIINALENGGSVAKIIKSHFIDKLSSQSLLKEFYEKYSDNKVKDLTDGYKWLFQSNNHYLSKEIIKKIGDLTEKIPRDERLLKYRILQYVEIRSYTTEIDRIESILSIVNLIEKEEEKK